MGVGIFHQNLKFLAAWTYGHNRDRQTDRWMAPFCNMTPYSQGHIINIHDNHNFCRTLPRRCSSVTKSSKSLMLPHLAPTALKSRISRPSCSKGES